MLSTINKQTLEEIGEDNVDKFDYDKLANEAQLLRENLNNKGKEIESKSKTIEALRTEVNTLKTRLKQEENFKDRLKEEVEHSNQRYLDLEDKFTKECMEGKAHIGLSKLDFASSRFQGGGMMSRISLQSKGRLTPGGVKNNINEEIQELDELEGSNLTSDQIRLNSIAIRSTKRSVFGTRVSVRGTIGKCKNL